MQYLEKHRRLVVRETNANLRIIFEKPDVEAIHNFRVGVKRLTALYSFLGGVQPGLDSKSILRTYRLLFKSLGRIREGHIALDLLVLVPVVPDARGKRAISAAVRNQVRRDLRCFRSVASQIGHYIPRLPGIASTGVPDTAILRHRKRVLAGLIEEVCDIEGRIDVDRWHRKRIRLKKYRYLLEAFRFTPGHEPEEEDLKQIKMVEQLLGDWHDMVTTKQFLQSLEEIEDVIRPVVVILDKRRTALLASARIYIANYAMRNGLACAE